MRLDKLFKNTRYEKIAKMSSTSEAHLLPKYAKALEKSFSHLKNHADWKMKAWTEGDWVYLSISCTAETIE